MKIVVGLGLAGLILLPAQASVIPVTISKSLLEHTISLSGSSALLCLIFIRLS